MNKHMNMAATEPLTINGNYIPRHITPQSDTNPRCSKYYTPYGSNASPIGEHRGVGLKYQEHMTL